MTSHVFEELIPMSDKDASDGWRILYDEDDPGHASIVYVVCHPQDEYDRTIHYQLGSETMSQDKYMRHFKPRLQEVDAPACWDDMLVQMGISEAVAHINTRRIDSALRGEGRHDG